MRYTHLKVVSAVFSGAILLAAVSMASLASAQTGGPTVVLTSSIARATHATSIPITATLSEWVSGFSSSDIAATNATVSNFTGSSTIYTFDLAPSADGTVTVMVPADVASSTTATSTSNQPSNTLTFTSDKTAPIISGVSVATTSSSATITWTTSDATDGQVLYGTTASYTATSTLDTSLQTSHTATLTGLSGSTLYHFQIRSADTAGNVGTTTDATFMTSTAALAPAISGISVSGISTTSATINWMTDLPASSQVSYGTTTSYGSQSAFDMTATTTHSVILNSLSEATLYHFAVNSANAVGTTTSADSTLVTASTSATTPLVVTSTDAVQTTATADDTFLHGFRWVMHLTVPDNENAFRMKFSDLVGTPSGTIPAGTNIRIFTPQSSNATDESSAITETDNSYGGWLYLTGDTGATTPGRQIDVTIEVRVPSGTPAGSYTTTFGAQSVPQSATSTTF